MGGGRGNGGSFNMDDFEGNKNEDDSGQDNTPSKGGNLPGQGNWQQGNQPGQGMPQQGNWPQQGFLQDGMQMSGGNASGNSPSNDKAGGLTGNQQGMLGEAGGMTSNQFILLSSSILVLSGGLAFAVLFKRRQG